MASPLVIFAAGMGTVALSLGAGFASSHFLVSAPVAQKTILANRPDPPPPTVEKVERKKDPDVAVEPVPVTVKTETTGSGGGWVSEPPKTPVAPTIPYLAPVVTAPAPAPAVA